LQRCALNQGAIDVGAPEFNERVDAFDRSCVEMGCDMNDDIDTLQGCGLVRGRVGWACWNQGGNKRFGGRSPGGARHLMIRVYDQPL
jgi:hypothetical protein